MSACCVSACGVSACGVCGVSACGVRACSVSVCGVCACYVSACGVRACSVRACSVSVCVSCECVWCVRVSGCVYTFGPDDNCLLQGIIHGRHMFNSAPKSIKPPSPHLPPPLSTPTRHAVQGIYELV